jgi:hypothetical protein
MRRIGLAIVLVLSVLAPLAQSQPAQHVYRIGILSSISATSDMVGPQPSSPPVNALLRGLRELGYVCGEHFVTEPRGVRGKFRETTGKRLELLKELVPGAAPVAILKDPRFPSTAWTQTESAARARALSSCSREVLSTLMPGGSPSRQPEADSPLCMHSGSMSKLAG